MTELQEPLLGEDVGVGVGGGGVDADKVGGQFVDPNGLLIEVAFDGVEGVTITESCQPVGQAVVVKVGGHDGFSEESGQCGLVLIDPGLDVVEAMVTLRDDEE
ncbi:hypothetical protein [Frigoriglobus tundricola]|uniref:Uncharacterized protein n=1 Tax=Frigoriglobus tundricola TaxID=2774151 RepID=A0A6M5YPN1_9BACT|nr:hypothetical protein [Frigoriglobus tundricola]QJW95878.1 hypothetical protein FTUN_3432 [Frigoriglobus tundricola]